MSINDTQLTLKQKVELAKWIVENNYHTAITGSILLWTLGIDIGREPQDIDILVRDIGSADFRDSLVLPPFTEEVDFESEDGYTVLARYMFFGTKIEFLLAKEHQDDCFYDDILLLKDLLEAKKGYLLSGSFGASKEKHAKDIKAIEEWLDKNKESLRQKYP